MLHLADISIEFFWYFLGCLYRAPSVHIAIRLPTDATIYFVYLFPFLPYMFRALIMYGMYFNYKDINSFKLLLLTL